MKATRGLLMFAVLSAAGLLTGRVIGGGYGYGYPYNYTGYTAPSIVQPTITDPIGAFGVNRYDPNPLASPSGAGTSYKADGPINP
jgi:hypothetical protein